MKKKNKLDIIVPIKLPFGSDECDKTVKIILDQYEKYGFDRFMLHGPSKGWRTVGFPPESHFVDLADSFVKIRDRLLPYKIECGWWLTTVVKSGLSEDFQRIIRANGSEAPFSSCPSDPNFRKALAKRIAKFAEIAKPSFIILEDDYSVVASAPTYGCFCDRHMEMLCESAGARYSRDELLEILKKRTPEALDLIKKWRAVMKESLVSLGNDIRSEVDKEDPQIPIGLMQAGAIDSEGDATFDICKALAGKDHIPFCRFYGTFYNGAVVENIPSVLFHPIYSHQHIRGEFVSYHESDSYPHTSFFTSGQEMRTIMSTAYSAGFDGSTFQVLQSRDCPDEDSTYSSMFARERKRFTALYEKASECKLKGVEITYDPFMNTVDTGNALPHWTKPLAMFGIPYTTTDEPKIAFWDHRIATYSDHDTVMKYLSKGLFLDGEAACVLAQRGYGQYLGVDVERFDTTLLSYDLSATENITDEFSCEGKGRKMVIACAFANGKEAKLVRLSEKDASCRRITVVRNGIDEELFAGMTVFKNSLGGTVVVMGLTIGESYTHSLYNYRRQRIIQQLISEISDDYVYVKENSRIFTLMNEPKDAENSRFIGLLTLTNLSSDARSDISLHLPKKWKEFRKIDLLDADGKWNPTEFVRNDEGVVICKSLAPLDSHYLIFR